MKAEIQNEATLTDMVFEHRNKEYGAYELRKNYGRNVNKALIIGVSLFIIALVSPLLFAKISPKTRVETGVIIDVKNFVEKNDKPIIEPPKEQAKAEVLIKTLAFLPPEPTPDEVAIDEPIPDIKTLETGVISNINREGADATSDYVAPAPIPEEKKPVSPAEIEDNSVKEIMFIEIQPEYVGGMAEMYSFLSKNLNYPSAAQRANVQGRVFLSFVIEKDGSISNLSTVKGIGFGCDEEAMRVIKLMPKWKPGRQQGNPVRVKFTLPVIFRLAD